MSWVTTSLLVLATLHAIFSAFTVLVGVFTNGGDVWQRLLLSIDHPAGAALWVNVIEKERPMEAVA